MPTFLLRLEAVNFRVSCYDTNDISTIRGGSMMLSNAHELVRSQLPRELQGEPVSYGASHAIWEFTLDNNRTAEQVRDEALRALAGDKLLRHATFVCGVIPKNDGSAEEVKHLRMLNHWSQLQQPTVTAPDLPRDTDRDDRKPYCEFDGVRPSVETVRKGDDNYRVSASTKARREYGRKQKQEFHAGLTEEQVAVVHELSELTAHPDPNHRLTHKMAIIYVDGNKQSEMAAQLDLADLGLFRSYVRDKHREFLTALLRWIATTRPKVAESSEWYFWNAKEQRHQVRLETLLWGGDDIIFVVPAWQGWSVVQQFYQHASGWEFQGTRFTHATGMVLCNYKAPIQSMRRFAEQLLILAKKDCAGGEYQDRIAYEVLESFDVPRADLDRWRAARLRKQSGAPDDTDEAMARQLLVKPEQMPIVEAMVRAVHSAVGDLDSGISRRQIETRSREMQRHQINEIAFNDKISQYLAVVPEFSDLADLSARQKMFHLTTLWDYIA